MIFLSPLFWLASAAVAVPVLLHLTQKAARRAVPFSSLMFLRRVPRVEVRKRRIRHPLLLALRLVGLLLIVAAFTRPVIRGDWLAAWPTAGLTSTVLLVDVSLSMSRERVWDRACARVESRLDALAPGDELLLVRFDQTAERVSGWERDRGRLKAAFQQQVQPKAGSTDYAAALRFAAEQLETASNPERVICLVTDLQQTGGALERLGSLELPADVALAVDDAGQQSTNHYLQGIQLSRYSYGSESPQPITARIGTSSSPPDAAETDGSASPASFDVRLYLGEELIDRRSATPDASGAATVEFPPFKLPEGAVRGRLVFDGADELAADDAVYFVLERRRPVPILLISPRQEGSVFLEAALSAGRNAPVRVETRPILGPVDPRQFPLLILDDVPAPSPAHLRRYLDGGGSLIVCLGEQVEAEAYTGALSGLLPARLQEKVYAGALGRSFINIESWLESHPILRPLSAVRGGGLEAVPFYAYWRLDPRESSQVLARLSTGDPLLVEASPRPGTGAPGSVLLFASSLGSTWSGFATHSVFLPFWQQAVRSLAGLPETPAAAVVGESAATAAILEQVSRRDEGRGADVLTPGGTRLAGLGEDLPERIMFREPGFYEVRSGGGTNWIAVNTDRRESELSRLKPGALESALGRSGAGRGKGRAEPREQGLWWGLLLGAGILLLIEAWLAARLTRVAPVRRAISAEGGR